MEKTVETVEWMQEALSGEYPSLNALASKHGLQSQNFAGRIMADLVKAAYYTRRGDKPRRMVLRTEEIPSE